MSGLRVLMLVEQCNPEWASVPLLGYRFWDGVSRLCEVCLVTHERNRTALEKVRDGREIVYLAESGLVRRYYALVHRLAGNGTNWPLLHALGYPVYASFDRRARIAFADRVRRGEFGVVHALTPILPRYPVGLFRADCPAGLVLGPVNGGLPFPRGFAERARKEHAALNVLRAGTRLIPGYARTYRVADLVLAGSAHTRDMLASMFGLGGDRLVLFPENGIPESFLLPPRPPRRAGAPLRCLFAGRLTAYKGADIALRALARVRARGLDASLEIVGDGAERAALEALARETGPGGAATFAGWVPQARMAERYAAADVFVFPSIREFGGAVVLEAMAAGLPCVVADHGGIAEYVTPQCGVKVPPRSEADLEAGVAEALAGLAADPGAWDAMSAAARGRAAEYAWPERARRMLDFYRAAADSRRRA